LTTYQFFKKRERVEATRAENLLQNLFTVKRGSQHDLKNVYFLLFKRTSVNPVHAGAKLQPVMGLQFVSSAVWGKQNNFNSYLFPNPLWPGALSRDKAPAMDQIFFLRSERALQPWEASF